MKSISAIRLTVNPLPVCLWVWVWVCLTDLLLILHFKSYIAWFGLCLISWHLPCKIIITISLNWIIWLIWHEPLLDAGCHRNNHLTVVSTIGWIWCMLWQNFTHFTSGWHRETYHQFSLAYSGYLIKVQGPIPFQKCTICRLPLWWFLLCLSSYYYNNAISHLSDD